MNAVFGYPAREEIEAAVKACCGRCCRACETPVEYAWRARDVELARLLRMAVENDLSDLERAVVTMRWFADMGTTEIAKRLGVTPSAVSHTLSRGEKRLYELLRYAVYYRCDTLDERTVPAMLMRARAVLAAGLTQAEDFASAVKKERLAQGLSEEKTEEYAGLEPGRLRLIENGEEPLDTEKAKLGAFFAITPRLFDETGDKNNGQDKIAV
ncbi:MAG: hypothetical protein J5562_00930 [Clostridia bacterium]|nr:hypothetical protein [Clostridia bacterium]